MVTSRYRKVATRVAATAALLGLSVQAQATLLLDPTVTGGFSGHATTTNTHGNDLPGVPSSLRFGQLWANTDGFVDFYYLGNEAGFTNWLRLDDHNSISTAGRSDNVWNRPLFAGTIDADDNDYLDFGFCTDGGNNVSGGWGKCAYNDSRSSLRAQYNYNNSGYRSIAYAPLASFNTNTGAWSLGSGSSSNLWMIFWDDSGAKNDDNHDDYIAIARFRPETTVSEPATTVVLGAALLGLAVVRLRRRRSMMI